MLSIQPWSNNCRNEELWHNKERTHWFVKTVWDQIKSKRYSSDCTNRSKVNESAVALEPTWLLKRINGDHSKIRTPENHLCWDQHLPLTDILLAHAQAVSYYKSTRKVPAHIHSNCSWASVQCSMCITWSWVGQFEVLICKFLPVDGFSTCTISFREISSLKHNDTWTMLWVNCIDHFHKVCADGETEHVDTEFLDSHLTHKVCDNPVENRTFVVKRLARSSQSLFTWNTDVLNPKRQINTEREHSWCACAGASIEHSRCLTTETSTLAEIIPQLLNSASSRPEFSHQCTEPWSFLLSLELHLRIAAQ